MMMFADVRKTWFHIAKPSQETGVQVSLLRSVSSHNRVADCKDTEEPLRDRMYKRVRGNE